MYKQKHNIHYHTENNCEQIEKRLVYKYIYIYIKKLRSLTGSLNSQVIDRREENDNIEYK